MQVLQLERAHFIQYQPATDWCDMILDITVVPRDEAWWSASLGAMQCFYNEWQAMERRMAVDEVYRNEIVDEWSKKNARKRKQPEPKAIDIIGAFLSDEEDGEGGEDGGGGSPGA